MYTRVLWPYFYGYIATFRQKCKEKQGWGSMLHSQFSVHHIEGEILDSKMAAAVKYSEEHHCILLRNGQGIMSFTSGARLVCVRPRIKKIQLF